MLLSLRSRLWASYFLIAFLVILIAGLALALYLIRNPGSDRRELLRLRLVSNLVVQRAEMFNLDTGASKDRRLVEAAQRADNTLGVRLALYNPDGALLVDSRLGRVSALPAFEQLSRARRANRMIFRDETGMQWLYVMTPMQSGETLLVAIPRPRLPLWSILMDEFYPPLARGLLLALGLSLLMGFWIARWISAPLQRLAEAARSLGAGRVQKIRLEGPREVREVAGSFNDMVDRVEASQRAQRDLVANVSHDLKTPLTSIQGFAQAILDGTAGDPASAQQAAQVIFDEAGRMHRLVLDLLDLARMDAGTFSFERAPLSLDQLLYEVTQKFQPQAQAAGIVLEYEQNGQEGLLAIIGDADRLSQVFSNLVDNALKFTPSGGTVHLEVRRAGGLAEVSVEDTGPGIPDNELERIFERFYQTDKSRQAGRRNGQGRGAGLGLAIAREIVQAHGGTLEVYNRAEAQGCVFQVRLPLARPDDETLAHHPAGHMASLDGEG